jgi:voltage-gated potassium channel Kch
MSTDTPTAPPPMPERPRIVRALTRHPLTVWRAARLIGSVTLTVTLISGALMTLVDHQHFENVGDGFWWAVQTVTTVGYGDFVPTNTLGRLLATLVMLVGIAFVTVATAAVTASFVEAGRRRIEIASGRDVDARFDRVIERLDAIDASIKALSEQKADDPK